MCCLKELSKLFVKMVPSASGNEMGTLILLGASDISIHKTCLLCVLHVDTLADAHTMAPVSFGQY